MKEGAKLNLRHLILLVWLTAVYWISCAAWHLALCWQPVHFYASGGQTALESPG